MLLFGNIMYSYNYAIFIDSRYFCDHWYELFTIVPFPVTFNAIIQFLFVLSLCTVLQVTELNVIRYKLNRSVKSLIQVLEIYCHLFQIKTDYMNCEAILVLWNVLIHFLLLFLFFEFFYIIGNKLLNLILVLV